MAVILVSCSSFLLLTSYSVLLESFHVFPISDPYIFRDPVHWDEVLMGNPFFRGRGEKGDILFGQIPIVPQLYSSLFSHLCPWSHESLCDCLNNFSESCQPCFFDFSSFYFSSLAD